MRHALLASLLALLPLAATAEDLGPIHFTPPDGWQSTRNTNASGTDTRLFIAPGSDQQHQAAILIVLSPKSDTKLDLRANFDQAVKGALGGRKVLKASEVTSSKSRDGYDVVSQLVAAANDDSQTNLLIVRCTAANIDDRLAAFCYVANDGPTFEEHQDAFNTLLSNTRLGDAKPKTSPLDAISSAPPREAGAAAETAPPQAKSTLPDPAAVLKDEESRRKPGYVTGRVYDSTGRPFALKGATVEVHVFGTSFGGKNVGYNIAVDASGNYEMRVPDGLYRATCEANIPFNGETLPVTLDAADGQPYDNDLNSADKGICKDWILKLSGERAGGAERHGHNGWDFCAVDGGDPLHWFSSRGASTPQITLTLTPTSPLLDGSKGQPLQYRCDPKTLSTVNRFPGTPIASYRVTATLTYPDGSTRAGLITTDITGKNQSDHADITFRRSPDRSALGTLVTPYVYVTDVQR